MMKRHKIALVVILVIAALMISFHYFITQKSAYILKRIVLDASGGKYELEANSVKFSYLSEIIQATGIRINPVAAQPDRLSYQLDADTIVIELRSIWPLVFQRSLDIQEVALINPSLVIKGKKPKTATGIAEFNLHDNLLIIQEQMDKMIHDLRMENFRIDNLSLRIYSDQQRYFQIDRVFLHINDLFADVSNMKKHGNLELEGAIHLWIDKPNIIYPDSNLSVSLDHFDWQSRERNLTIQNIGFSWRQQKAALDSIHVQLHAVTFSKFQWAEWITTGRMFYDSIAASTGAFYMQKLNASSKNDTAVKSRKGILYLVSPISVQHLVIREIKSSVLLMANSTPIEGSLKGDSLKVEHLNVDVTREDPIQLSTFDLAIREFDSKDREQEWQTSFASFRINKNHVILKDYLIRSKGLNNPGHGNIIRVPELAMKGLSLPELAMGKVVVKELTLESPFVQIALDPKNRDSKKGYRPFRESFPFLNVQSVFVHNGSFVSRDKKTGEVRVQAGGIRGHLYANKLLAARSLQDYPATSDVLGIETLQLNLPKWQIVMHQVQVNPLQNSMLLHDAKVNLSKPKGHIEFRNINIEFDSVRSSIKDRKSLYLNKMTIDSGTVNLDLGRNEVVEDEKKDNPVFPVYIKAFTLGNTKIELRKDDQRFQSHINALTLNKLSTLDHRFVWGQLDAALAETHISSESWTLNVKRIHLDNEGSSSLDDLQFNSQKDGTHITAAIPRLVFGMSMHKPETDSLHISTIDIHQPEISYTHGPMEAMQTPRAKMVTKEKNISFVVDSIHIRQPRIHLDSKRGSGSVQLQTQIHEINFSQTAFAKTADSIWGLDVDKIYFHAGNTSMEQDSGMRFSFAGLQTTILDLHKPASGKLVHFNINKLALDSLHFDQDKKDNKTVIDSRRIVLTENTPVTTDKDSILNTIYGMPSLELQGTTVLLDNKARVIQFMNVNANLPAKSFSADSFRLQPKMSRDSFFANQPIEKDYITMNSGAIQATAVNLIKDYKDTGFAINKLSLDHFFIKAERDKRRPDDTILYKPLLVKMIQKIPFHFAVDTLALQSSTIEHNVIAEKTGEEATIFFTDVNGWIGDLRTFRIQDQDSLRIRVYAKLMGKGDLYMRFRQSYRDSLQSFSLAARMGPFDMTDLDRILVPLTRIRITRGVIDTLWLQANANDLFAFGSMEIDYRKLHVEKLDKNEKKQGFISWLANIIVRSRNRKEGTIYVERLQDKAIFNYWGKIALSGLLTNIRVASSKKNKKKYEAALKKYQLPNHMLNEN